MEKEGGNRERMRKCREPISLHFLIFSPFPPHFLILSPFPRSPAARLQRFVQPCVAVLLHASTSCAFLDYLTFILSWIFSNLLYFSSRELRKKLLMLAPNAHSWVWQGLVPLVTGASFRQQINSCVWPSNQTHTIKVTTKIILSSAGPMSHACPVWPHPLPLAYYVILCIYVSFSDFWLRWLFPHLSQYVNVNTKSRRASSVT